MALNLAIAAPDGRCGWGRIGNRPWERVPGGTCSQTAEFDIHPHNIAQHLRVCVYCLPDTVKLAADALEQPVWIVQVLPS